MPYLSIKNFDSSALNPMKAMTKEISAKFGDRELPINTKNGRCACYIRILERIDSRMQAVLANHCKLYIVQFVIFMHEQTDKNEEISALMKVIKKQLEKAYRLRKLEYGWAREVGAGGKQHYHVVLFLDGNKVRAQGRIMDRVIKIATDRDYPRPSFGTRPHMVLRTDLLSYNNAFYHLSYLAKVSTKGYRPKTTNDYSFTRGT